MPGDTKGNMMNSEAEQQLHEIEVSIEQAKQHVAVKDALGRLSANPDFNKIVLEGYFKDEAVRLVQLRADPNFASEEDQAAVLRSIDAIGQFRLYCNTINQMGQMAENAIASDEATREQILAEDL